MGGPVNSSHVHTQCKLVSHQDKPLMVSVYAYGILLQYKSIFSAEYRPTFVSPLNPTDTYNIPEPLEPLLAIACFKRVVFPLP